MGLNPIERGRQLQRINPFIRKNTTMFLSRNLSVTFFHYLSPLVVSDQEQSRENMMKHSILSSIILNLNHDLSSSLFSLPFKCCMPSLCGRRNWDSLQNSEKGGGREGWFKKLLTLDFRYGVFQFPRDALIQIAYLLYSEYVMWFKL